MKIAYSKTFVKQVKKLSPQQKNKLAERVEIFIQNPEDTLLRNYRLKGKYIGWNSIDIAGDLRLLYIENNDEIIFDQIGTHSQLYG
jgi:addiction module RelE/StbE family toxin